MTEIGDLACFNVTGGEDAAEMLGDLAVIGLLRGLQEQAETAGLRITAILISAATQAAMDEGVRMGPVLPN